MDQRSAFDFTLDGLDGTPLPLRRFAGTPLLIVNTASKCGFTPQYAGLQALWERERARGLTVIGVPSNDFAGQEPGGNAEIAGFCSRTFGVTFPLSAKLHVRGRQADPLFRWLAAQGGPLSRPRWNFFKYVIGRDGRLAGWFSSVAGPDSARVRAAVERAIGAP